MARLYGDENFDHPVIESLRRLGHDVVTVQDAGMANQQIPDEDVLSFAHRDERAVLTFNRRDFINLHRLGLAHSGIIVCTRDPNITGLAQRIHDALENCPVLARQLIRINRPHAP